MKWNTSTKMAVQCGLSQYSPRKSRGEVEVISQIVYRVKKTLIQIGN